MLIRYYNCTNYVSNENIPHKRSEICVQFVNTYNFVLYVFQMCLRTLYDVIIKQLTNLYFFQIRIKHKSLQHLLQFRYFRISSFFDG